MTKWANEQEARKAIAAQVGEFYLQFKQKDKSFTPGDKISYAGRVFDEQEMQSLADAMLDFWLTAGRFTQQFEAEFSKLFGVKYTSLVNSGSSANLLAFMALTSLELGQRRIKRGDEIITVACAFPTTVNPIIQYGAIPVFVDVAIPQYNLDVTKLEAALSDKTKAVMLAHTLGNPFDIQAVKAFCDRHNLWLIEDNCDALGSRYTYNGKSCYTGTMCDIATSSFYPPHHITMGEGGAVYTNNPLLHKLVNSFRDWGRACECPSGQDNLCGHRFDGQFGKLPKGYDHKYVYSHFGYNLKATDMQAAIGCAQLKKFPEFARRRKENWSKLKDLLLPVSDKLILPEKLPESEPCWFGFLLTAREGVSREKIVREIEAKGVQTRMLFAGNIIKHPCFDEMRRTCEGYRICGTLENTDRIMRDSFWVGVYAGLTAEMLKYMAEVIIKAVK